MLQGFHIQVLPVDVEGLDAHPDIQEQRDESGKYENQDNYGNIIKPEVFFHEPHGCGYKVDKFQFIIKDWKADLVNFKE
jgi:hypothetical protein